VSSLELLFPAGLLAYGEIALRLVLAGLLAGVLGWDREEKDRPAGLRTYMLVALASAVRNLRDGERGPSGREI
jgi:putative Mg2+ transporter-C (MgtC) family protein